LQSEGKKGGRQDISRAGWTVLWVWVPSGSVRGAGTDSAELKKALAKSEAAYRRELLVENAHTPAPGPVVTPHTSPLSRPTIRSAIPPPAPRSRPGPRERYPVDGHEVAGRSAGDRSCSTRWSPHICSHPSPFTPNNDAHSHIPPLPVPATRSGSVGGGGDGGMLVPCRLSHAVRSKRLRPGLLRRLKPPRQAPTPSPPSPVTGGAGRTRHARRRRWTRRAWGPSSGPTSPWPTARSSSRTSSGQGERRTPPTLSAPHTIVAVHPDRPAQSHPMGVGSKGRVHPIDVPCSMVQFSSNLLMIFVSLISLKL